VKYYLHIYRKAPSTFKKEEIKEVKAKSISVSHVNSITGANIKSFFCIRLISTSFFLRKISFFTVRGIFFGIEKDIYD
jgi:hypothetical protein